MKNLKKILFAIVSVMLVVSMALTFALAVAGEETEQAANLAQAQAVLNDQVKGAADNTAKAEGLGTLYALLSTKSFDTESEDYKTLVKEYNKEALDFIVPMASGLVANTALSDYISDIDAFLNGAFCFCI